MKNLIKDGYSGEKKDLGKQWLIDIKFELFKEMRGTKYVKVK